MNSFLCNLCALRALCGLTLFGMLFLPFLVWPKPRLRKSSRHAKILEGRINNRRYNRENRDSALSSVFSVCFVLRIFVLNPCFFRVRSVALSEFGCGPRPGWVVFALSDYFLPSGKSSRTTAIWVASRDLASAGRARHAPVTRRAPGSRGRREHRPMAGRLTPGTGPRSGGR